MPIFGELARVKQRGGHLECRFSYRLRRRVDTLAPQQKKPTLNHTCLKSTSIELLVARRLARGKHLHTEVFSLYFAPASKRLVFQFSGKEIPHQANAVAVPPKMASSVAS